MVDYGHGEGMMPINVQSHPLKHLLMQGNSSSKQRFVLSSIFPACKNIQMNVIAGRSEEVCSTGRRFDLRYRTHTRSHPHSSSTTK